jgi:hypothetical protein
MTPDDIIIERLASILDWFIEHDSLKGMTKFPCGNGMMGRDRSGYLPGKPNNNLQNFSDLDYRNASFTKSHGMG